MMTSEAPVPLHTPPSPSAIRPKGILKNPSSTGSYRSTSEQASFTIDSSSAIATSPESLPRPDLIHEQSDKEITLQNTIQNAGHRRSSSAARSSAHRMASQSSSIADADDAGMRLKWDETNLILTEQEKSSTMKIDEPKTPYARHYDPAEDEDEIRMLDAQDLVVDELDGYEGKKSRAANIEEIPGLSLGEPEEAIPDLSADDARNRKAVHVSEEDQSHESLDSEKHRKFEEMRKKHYEMRNVANLLGHPEDADDDEEEVRVNGARNA